MGMAAVLANKRQWHVETGCLRKSLKLLPDGCVHSVVTSPPYFALRSYLPDEHPDKSLEMGSERTPEEYVANMVDAFREVRRVLHNSGTLWLNLGDSYSAHPGQRKTTDKIGDKQSTNAGSNTIGSRSVDGLAAKQLIGIPFRVAFALQADGWYLRSIIPWIKRNPMPESVTDRPSSAVEYVFLLAKSDRYFYDAEAVKVGATCDRMRGPAIHPCPDTNGNSGLSRRPLEPNRNRRNSDAFFESWQGLYEEDGEPLGLVVNPAGFSGAHFATFPTKLVQPMLAAGTSERGACSGCGEPWRRVVESERIKTRPGEDTKLALARGGTLFKDSDKKQRFDANSDIVGNRDPYRHVTATKTIGWEAGCKCSAPVVPCLAMDIFNGAGTVGLMCKAMGRRYIGLELFEEYAEMSRRRIDKGMVEDAPKQPKSMAGQRDMFTGAAQ